MTTTYKEELQKIVNIDVNLAKENLEKLQKTKNGELFFTLENDRVIQYQTSISELNKKQN